MSERIVIVDYDPEWAQLFAREASGIRGALGNRALQIEHVGSTSVPGLPAKPIIDIVLVVADSADETAYAPALEAAGYIFAFREPEWWQHRMFHVRDDIVNLHVFSAGCPEIERMLTFRNWLRSSDADRDLYARTKQSLAQKAWPTVQDYADAKSAIVQEILARARPATGYQLPATENFQ